MRIAALLVHGFGGDRTVWGPLAPTLEERGITVTRLALSGHEDDAAALASTPFTTWLDEMRAAVGELRARHDQVCLVGYSMGATLGLYALAEHLVDAAVLVSPSVSVPAVQRAAVSALSLLRVPAIPRRFVGTGDEEAGEDLPVAALATNIAFKDTARELTLRNPAPALLLAGAEDDVASPEATAEVLRKFPDATRLVTLAGGDHGLVDGPLSGQVADLVGGFLTESASPH